MPKLENIFDKFNVKQKTLLIFGFIVVVAMSSYFLFHSKDLTASGKGQIQSSPQLAISKNGTAQNNNIESGGDTYSAGRDMTVYKGLVTLDKSANVYRPEINIGFQSGRNLYDVNFVSMNKCASLTFHLLFTNSSQFSTAKHIQIYMGPVSIDGPIKLPNVQKKRGLEHGPESEIGRGSSETYDSGFTLCSETTNELEDAFNKGERIMLSIEVVYRSEYSNRVFHNEAEMVFIDKQHGYKIGSLSK